MVQLRKKRTYASLLWLVVPVIIFSIFARYLIAGEPQEEYLDDTLGLKTGEATETSLHEFRWRGEALITFWFDDAWRSQYDEGFKILDKYGYKAAVAVPIEPIGYEAYMNWHQIRKLHYLGWEITSHSRTHDCDLVYKGEDAFKYEILGGKEDLEKYGIKTKIYVAPCGETTPEATSYIKDNFSYQRIVEPGFNPIPVNDPYGVMVKQVSRDISATTIRSWIDEAINSREWLVLMLHQVDNEETEYGTTPETLEGVVDYVNKSNISVVLPTQALSI